MSYFDDVQTCLQHFDASQLVLLQAAVAKAREQGRTVYICGNGGSMVNALHWATDLTKAANVQARALASNLALLTAFANDLGYDTIFRRELESLRDGDVLICLSCSGTSANIQSALAYTRQQKLMSFLVTGPWVASSDWMTVINIPSNNYGVIEDVHAMIGHWLTRELA